MGIVKPCYKVILPKTEGDFEVQWEDCYNELSDILKNTEFKPFRINVFLDTVDQTDYHSKSNLIRHDLDILGDGNKLPIGIIPQSPELSYHIAIEIGMIREKDGLVQYHSHEGLNYCTIASDELIEYWMIGVLSNGNSLNILDSSDCSFQKIKSILDYEELNFESIVRQWNYVGEILNLGTISDCNMQYYQMFNEVRNTFYSQYRNCPGFPAATGIGMNYKNVGIDCYAIGKNPVLEIIPIRNPNQQDSYHYSQDVLIGASIKPKQPPQFERAILLNSSTSSRLIISGTASIIGQNTIGIGDIEKQTQVTIENIEALASHPNLERQCPNLAEYPDKYSYLRVYVKNRNDISTVKTICSNHYGNVPMNFVQADICRDNLLVEIEAEKVN